MTIDQLIDLLIFSSIPGATGGVATFLYSLKKGHYKNNRYSTKLTIEILGGSIMASFLSPLFSLPIQAHLFVGFAIGSTWAGLIQVTRSKITKIVKAVIGEELR